MPSGNSGARFVRRRWTGGEGAFMVRDLCENRFLRFPGLKLSYDLGSLCAIAYGCCTYGSVSRDRKFR